MSQHQPTRQQTDKTFVGTSDSRQGALLPLASQPVHGQDADYIKVTGYLKDRADEISNLFEVLHDVQARQKVEKNPERLCQAIDQQLTLERHIRRLEEERDDIRWQVISRQATLTFSDSAAQRLLDIQGQIGQATGALSAVGAGLAFSLLFSATRGDLWCMYAAYWLFIIALCVTSALGLAGSGVDEGSKRPSQKEWTARRWSLLGILIGVLSVIGGFFAFCVAVIGYDLSEELQTGKGVITGPRPGGWNRFVSSKVIDLIFVSAFAVLWITGFWRALRPGLQLKNRKQRRAWHAEMLHSSQSTRQVKAKMLSDILDEGSAK